MRTPAGLTLNGLVLAGGYSTRMGTDKSLLVYNGKPQREYLFDLLSERCDRVFTSCRKDQDVPGKLNPLADSTNIPGPLNGIISAFAFQADASWLIVAVDMPFIFAPTLALLINNRDRKKYATCFYNPQTQLPEPLLTLWEAHAYPSLQEFVKNGKISAREFLKTHPIRMIDPPDEKTLVNVNYRGSDLR